MILLALVLCTLCAGTEVSIFMAVQKDVPILYLRQALESLSPVLDIPDYELLLVQIGNLGYEREIEFQRVVQQQNQKEKYVVVPGREGDSYSSALNRASFMAKGEYLLFMDSYIEIPHIKTLTSLLGLLKSDRSVGIVSPKILFPDETIAHFGLRLAFEPDTWTWGAKGKNYLGYDYYLQGFASTHPLTTDTKNVTAVSKWMMMVSAQLFSAVGKFDESFHTDIFMDVSLCLKVREKGMKIVILPLAIAQNNMKISRGLEYFKDDASRQDLIKFDTMWSEHATTLKSNYQIQNFTLIWNSECGSGQVLGFTTEAIHFLMALYTKVELKMEVGSGRESECLSEASKLGYPSYITNILYRLLHASIPEGNDVVLVLHRDPGRYTWFLSSLPAKKDYYVIGRSMFETSGIPKDWVIPANSQEIEEIWVPTEFNQLTFADAGVNASKISVVPELTDVHHFDPKGHSPLFLNHDNYVFLSIMKWEERKAWKSLFRAYFDEFSSSVLVQLRILARMKEDDEKAFKEFKLAYMNETSKKEEDLPRVSFIKDFIPYSLLPNLYNSANAFVLASHGEGWGLPLMEAMAMKKPTIGTNWGGNLAFMNPSNSFLVDVERMEKAPKPNDSQEWAVPDLKSLRSIMRHLVEGTFANESSIVHEGRSSVIEYFSYEPGANLIIEKLKVIKTKIPAVKSRKNPPPTSWRNYSASTGKAPATNNPPPLEPVFVDPSTGITRYRAKIIND